MGLNLSLHIASQTASGHEVSFHSDHIKAIKIGRAQTSQICLDDAKVARVHAVIELSASGAVLVDMGSTAGTYVNGQKVTRVKLQDGDRLMLGDTEVGVALQAGADPLAQAPEEATPAGVILAPGPPGPGRAGPAHGQNTESAAAQAQMHEPGPLVAPAGDRAVRKAAPSDISPEEVAVRRLSQSRLRAATAEQKPHPAIPSEVDMGRDNRVLELRLYWGEVLLSMDHYTRPKRVLLGEHVADDIFLSSEGLPTEQFPLIRYRDSEYALTFSRKMEGEVEAGGQTQTLEQLAANEQGGAFAARKDVELDNCFTLNLVNDARVLLHWGGATLALRFVPPARILPAPFGKDIDLQFINSSIFSVFSHAAIILMLAVYPHNTDALKVDLFGAPDRFASLILEAPKETKSTKDMLEKIKKQVEEKKEEKKFTAQQKPADVLKQPVKIPTMAQATAHRSVEDKKQEVTQRFSKLLGGGAGSLLGGGGGGNLSGTLQNVIGTAGSASASAGLAGLGIRGSGPLTGGGIGTSRGLAGIGTTGRLGGGGASYGGGVGLGRGKAHNLVDLDTPQVEGALSADVIKRVINENKNQVRYCYEVELQHNQNLEGRVQMRWVISGTGAVAEVHVKDSTIKNTNVENCLMQKIRSWKFPPPAGGGTVEVNYPFVFKAS